MKENKRKKLNEPTMFTLSVMCTANCAVAAVILSSILFGVRTYM